MHHDDDDGPDFVEIIENDNGYGIPVIRDPAIRLFYQYMTARPYFGQTYDAQQVDEQGEEICCFVAKRLTATQRQAMMSQVIMGSSDALAVMFAILEYQYEGCYALKENMIASRCELTRRAVRQAFQTLQAAGAMERGIGGIWGFSDS